VGLKSPLPLFLPHEKFGYNLLIIFRKVLFYMTNEELTKFFKDLNDELDHIVLTNDEKLFKEWKKKLGFKLNEAYGLKLNKLEIFYDENIEDKFGNTVHSQTSLDENNLKIIKSILRDMYFKYMKKTNSKVNLEILKLLKAREENIDFELELAEMISGDNQLFPYRSSKYLTDFFQNLGFNFTHDGTTRKYWVKSILDELSIKEIHLVITKGLFKKKYFKEAAENNKENLDIYFKNATKEFEIFVRDSVMVNELFDLSTILDMNVNIELLFDNKAKTEDITLNELIEEARERFLNQNDKQIALEKLWDAFERLKTFFSDLEKKGKDKNKSAAKIVEIISKDFDKDFINDEFKKLTSIGNDYRIRHHEQNKLELTSNHTNYFFFRMLTLIDLCLVYLNEENE